MGLVVSDRSFLKVLSIGVYVKSIDFSVKKVKVNPRLSLFQTLLGPCPKCCTPNPREIGPLVPEKKILKDFYHNFIWTWLPSWSCDPYAVNKLSFPLPYEASLKFGFDWPSGFWAQWAHCGIFENGVLLMYTLEGVSSVANFITAYEESQ